MAAAAPLAALTFKPLWAGRAGTATVNARPLGEPRWPEQRRPPGPLYLYLNFVRSLASCVFWVSPFGQYPQAVLSEGECENGTPHTQMYSSMLVRCYMLIQMVHP